MKKRRCAKSKVVREEKSMNPAAATTSTLPPLEAKGRAGEVLPGSLHRSHGGAPPKFVVSRSFGFATALTGLFVLFFLALAGQKRLVRDSISNEFPGEGDFSITSFPKSGSFWLRFLIASVFALVEKKPTSSVNFNTIESIIPDLEFGDNRKHFDSLARIYGDIRLFKSHQPFHSNPKGPSDGTFSSPPPNCNDLIGEGMEKSQCLCPNCPARFSSQILLVRDGRSTLCSYFNFQKKLGNFAGNFSSFLRDEETSSYGLNWSDWMKSWLNNDSICFAGASFPDFRYVSSMPCQSNQNTVYVVRYEDLKDAKNALKTLSSLFDFLLRDRPATRKLVTKSSLKIAIAENDFETMKRKELRDGGGKLFRKFYPQASVETLILRSGQVDSYHDCFNREEDINFFFDGRGAREVLNIFGYF